MMTGEEWLAWRSVCMTSAQEQNGGPWDPEQGKWIRKEGDSRLHMGPDWLPRALDSEDFS